MFIKKIFLLCFLIKFISADDIDIWVDMLKNNDLSYFICFSREGNKYDKDKKKCETLNQKIREFKSMLQEHELEIKNREENIKNNNGGDYFNNRKNYFERMRESYYNYIALKNTYENVLDFWSRAFYYPKFFNLFGLVPLLKKTSFEKYMAFIAEKDYKNKITFDKINVYFGKR